MLTCKVCKQLCVIDLGASDITCDSCWQAQITNLEAMLASEVADNVRLRSRYTGDVEANLLQEICDLSNSITELESTLTKLREEVAEIMLVSKTDEGQRLSRIQDILYSKKETTPDA